METNASKIKRASIQFLRQDEKYLRARLSRNRKYVKPVVTSAHNMISIHAGPQNTEVSGYR